MARRGWRPAAFLWLLVASPLAAMAKRLKPDVRAKQVSILKPEPGEQDGFDTGASVIDRKLGEKVRVDGGASLIEVKPAEDPGPNQCCKWLGPDRNCHKCVWGSKSQLRARKCHKCREAKWSLAVDKANRAFRLTLLFLRSRRFEHYKPLTLDNDQDGKDSPSAWWNAVYEYGERTAKRIREKKIEAELNARRENIIQNALNDARSASVAFENALKVWEYPKSEQEEEKSEERKGKIERLKNLAKALGGPVRNAAEAFYTSDTRPRTKFPELDYGQWNEIESFLIHNPEYFHAALAFWSSASMGTRLGCRVPLGHELAKVPPAYRPSGGSSKQARRRAEREYARNLEARKKELLKVQRKFMNEHPLCKPPRPLPLPIGYRA